MEQFCEIASDGTEYVLAYADGIYTVTDSSGGVVCEFMPDKAASDLVSTEKVVAWGTRLIEFGESGAHVAICPECGYPIADYGVNEDIYCSWCGAKSESHMFTPSGPGYCATSLDRKSKVFDKLLLRGHGAKMDAE